MKGSYSKSQTIRRCLRKAYYRYELELRKKRRAVQLEKGSLIHECLDTYYKNPTGADWTNPIHKYVEEVWTKLFEEERAEYGDLPGEVYRIVQGYIRAYRDYDKDLKIIKSEMPFELNTPGGNILVGRIDLLAQDDAGLWVIDHKSCKAIPDENVRHTDIQTLLYVWACGQLGMKVSGAMFNYIKTKAPQMPSLLQSGKGMSRTAVDTDWFTYENALKKAGLNPADYEDMKTKLSGKVFFKRARVPASVKIISNLIAEFDQTMRLWEFAQSNLLVPRTRTRDCTWDCEYCPICFAELSGTDATYIIEEDYEKGGSKDGGEEKEADVDLG